MKEYQGRIMNMCMVGLLALGVGYMYVDQRTIARENHDQLYKLIADHFLYEELRNTGEDALLWMEARGRTDKIEKWDGTQESLEKEKALIRIRSGSMQTALNNYLHGGNSYYHPPLLSRWYVKNKTLAELYNETNPAHEENLIFEKGKLLEKGGKRND